MSDTEQKWNGECHCKKIKYQVNGKSHFEFFCHCEDCRKIHGGGRLPGMVFPKTALSFEGNPKVYQYTGGSGQAIELFFCSDCSTSLFAFPLQHEEIVVIRANSLCLEDSNRFQPQKSIFSDRAFSWDQPLESKD